MSEVLVLEERHQEWGLAFRTTWSPSPAYGWVRTSELVNRGSDDARLQVLDGLVDLMPAGVDAVAEQTRSNLVDAYKRSEVGRWGTAAVYTLESLITDRAEPGEALAATLVWSTGIASMRPLLDERAADDVATGTEPRPVSLLTGRPGAYLLHDTVVLPAGECETWTIVADTGLDHAAVVDRVRDVREPGIAARLSEDVAAGQDQLRSLLAGVDAFQRSADPMADAHHLSNSLFNAMRGGVFPYGYDIPVRDLVEFVRVRNRRCHERHGDALAALGEWAGVEAANELARTRGDPDLVRIILEYLPLTFSRRHGDPSRPWNRFTIRVRDETERDILTYEGNWRDIFQNWEALLQSYPAYFPHAVATFLNASTADGHNAYRISRDGIDWEVPDADDPWSNIGYWGDHQIVYLLRLLEAWEQFAPGELDSWADERIFVYADVPYTIADHEAMVRNPHETITFDTERARQIAERERGLGSDGRLLVTTSGSLVRAGLLEKLLVPALAKVSAFVPGGGIWMNTQRPEWNDANNALAGTGLSVVTLAHLVRYLRFVRDLCSRLAQRTVPVVPFVDHWLRGITDVLDQPPVAPTDLARRRALLDALGSVATATRHRITAGIGDETVQLRLADVERFCDTALAHLEHSLRQSRRPDRLYHSYNRISFPSSTEAAVHHLGEMLEGQVAVLSSGMLEGSETLEVLDALFDSGMYRADQNSFMLYPAAARPAFLDRNTLDAAQVQRLSFVASPIEDRWRPILAIDRDGALHFRPAMHNATALRAALDERGATPAQRAIFEEIYEEVFDHTSFTGRSGAMYGYEGIGSIYWHMVAKLLLAVQENHAAALARGEPADLVVDLARAYRRIRDGLGFRKSPREFGAFPTDCYSHTPAGGGARQPGMTGQVKEEILTRRAEIGLHVDAGTIHLAPGLIDPTELFGATGSERVSWSLCQVPIIVTPGDHQSIRTVWADGRVEVEDATTLPMATSKEIFARSGAVTLVEFTIDAASGDVELDGKPQRPS